LSVVIYSQHLFIRLIERHTNRVTRCNQPTHTRDRHRQRAASVILFALRCRLLAAALC
jgi:hypothetical protein